MLFSQVAPLGIEPGDEAGAFELDRCARCSLYGVRRRPRYRRVFLFQVLEIGHRMYSVVRHRGIKTCNGAGHVPDGGHPQSKVPQHPGGHQGTERTLYSGLLYTLSTPLARIWEGISECILLLEVLARQRCITSAHAIASHHGAQTCVLTVQTRNGPLN